MSSCCRPKPAGEVVGGGVRSQGLAGGAGQGRTQEAALGVACVGDGLSGRHGELGHHTGAGIILVKEGFG